MVFPELVDVVFVELVVVVLVVLVDLDEVLEVLFEVVVLLDDVEVEVVMVEVVVEVVVHAPPSVKFPRAMSVQSFKEEVSPSIPAKTRLAPPLVRDQNVNRAF